MDIHQHGVITADIVGSTRLDTATERALSREIRESAKTHKIEFYRGDSFQLYVRDPTEALQAGLLARAIARSYLDSDGSNTDLRLSIGVGPVVHPVRDLATARGEAFLLSGRGMDRMAKTGERLVIAAGTAEAGPSGIAADLLAAHLDQLFRELTVKQAALIRLLLTGRTQAEAAKRLKKSNSTVSQLAAAARWDQMQRLLEAWQQLLTLLSTNS